MPKKGNATTLKDQAHRHEEALKHNPDADFAQKALNHRKL
jgi:hypothetical protein